MPDPTIDELKKERDALQQQNLDLRASFDRRVASEVTAAMANVQAEQKAASDQWAQERQTLQARIKQLEDGPHIAGAAVTPTQLAGSFASTLASLAEGPASPERGYSAALTSLEVEAKGILRAPTDPQKEPTFVTVEDPTIQAGQLSTMKMTFRLLPRVGEQKPNPSG